MNSIRNHPNWIRNFAALNFVSITIGYYFNLLRIRSGIPEGVYIDLWVLAWAIILGVIGSIGLWVLNTRLIRYKPIIVLLYIPCLFFSGSSISLHFFTFRYSRYVEILNILEILVKVLMVFIEVFILICFWNNSRYKKTS